MASGAGCREHAQASNAVMRISDRIMEGFPLLGCLCCQRGLGVIAIGQLSAEMRRLDSNTLGWEVL